MDDDETPRNVLPSIPKLKEEYSVIANDFSTAFSWVQREIMASQTLRDLSKRPTPAPSTPKKTTFKEEEESSGDEMCKSPPPIETVIATNKKGDEMLVIAEALEDLHCDKKRTNEEETTMTDMENSQPKPKKRRRRRHEIARNFKCPNSGCTKSYGSEGALKTHIRLKHSESANQKKKETLASVQWPMPQTAGVFLPKTMYQTSFAGDHTLGFTQQQSLPTKPILAPPSSFPNGPREDMVESLKLPPLPNLISHRPAGFPDVLPSFKHFFNPTQQ